MEETLGQRKVVGLIWLLAAVISIGTAFLVQPVGEWGTFGILLVILMALLGLTGAWILITGRGHITNTRMSPRSQLILSIFGIIGATVLVISYLVSDWANWTAIDVLTIGVWFAIGAMFLQGAIIARSRS
jgi:hypothetical protein